MEQESKRLDEMQSAYKAGVEAWIVAIWEDEALPSVNHSVAEIDCWEHVHSHEEELRNKANLAKAETPIAQCVPHITLSESHLADGSLECFQLSEEADAPLSVIVVGALPDIRHYISVIRTWSGRFCGAPIRARTFELRDPVGGTEHPLLQGSVGARGRHIARV
jgi:hypothetical protein